MEISQTLDYKQSAVAHSEYKLTRLLQQTGGTSQTITTSDYTSVFEIPAVCFNPSQSILEFKYDVGDVKTKYNCVYRDTLPIRRLELLTRSGAYLMDINNFQQFIRATNQMETDIIALSGMDITTDGKGATNFGHDLYGRSAQALEVPQALFAGAVGDDAGAGDINIRVRVKLGDLKNTFMSIDKSIFVGEILNLRITWGSREEWYFTADSALGATPIAPTADVSLTDLRIHLAQETNAGVCQQLMEKVNTSGMSVLIPFVHSYKTNQATTSQSVSLRFSRGHGQRLEKVYHSIFPNAENVGVRYDNSVSDTKLVSFYTLVNQKRRQEFDYNALDAWSALRPYNRGMISGIAYTEYRDNFCWVDSFVGNLHNSASNGHVVGLPLEQEVKWDLYATTDNATYNHYSFAVCQRELVVNSAGVQVV